MCVVSVDLVQNYTDTAFSDCNSLVKSIDMIAADQSLKSRDTIEKKHLLAFSNIAEWSLTAQMKTKRL